MDKAKFVPDRETRQLKLRYKILIPFISLVVFFAIPELCLRIYVKAISPAKVASSEWIESSLKFDILKHDYLEPDPVLHWRLKTKKTSVAVNSLGTRGREFSKNKGPGIFRIVCLGDSCTYGACVMNEEQIYGRVLEKMLNTTQNTSRRYEVIIAGVPGYSSYQGLVYLKDRILGWGPDLITVYFGNNCDYAINRYYDLEPLFKFPLTQRIGGILDKSYFYNLIKSCLLKLKINLLARIDKNFSSRFRRSSYEFIKLHYLKMADIARENNFKIFFLNYPHILHPDTTLGQKAMINQIIKEAADRAGAPLVDIVKTLNSSGGERLFADEVHPNAAGHGVIARMIFKTMLDGGIISKDDYDAAFLEENLKELNF